MQRSPFIFDCSRFIGRKKLQASQRECRKPCTIPLDLTRMKKIEAIIAPTEFEAVREGLRAAGILCSPGHHAGMGTPILSAFSSPGAALNRDLISTLKIGVIVSDSMAPKAVGQDHGSGY
jgi:hypothetical protein